MGKRKVVGGWETWENGAGLVMGVLRSVACPVRDRIWPMEDLESAHCLLGSSRCTYWLPLYIADNSGHLRGIYDLSFLLISRKGVVPTFLARQDLQKGSSE